MLEILLAIAIGAVAGVFAGLFGVGGGILFVPALVALFGLGQVEAEATSLLAILPVVAASTWQQRRYGNVSWRVADPDRAYRDLRRRGRGCWPRSRFRRTPSGGSSAS